MKTSALTFFAGLAVGAAVFQVSDRLIFDRKTETSHSTQGIRPTTGTPSGERARSSRRANSRDGQAREVDSATVLKQIEELQSFADMDFSNLQIGRLIADIGSLSGTKAHQLLMELEKLEEDDDWNGYFELISSTVMLRMVELNGLEAVLAFENNRYPVFMNRYGEDMTHSLVSFWSDHDPEAARDWLVSQLNTNPEDRGILSEQVDDPYVLEAFFLNYEKNRPGDSMALLSRISSDELRSEATGHALHARIRLADEPGNIPNILNESVSLVGNDAFNVLLDTAVERDWQTTTQWVEDMEPSDNQEQNILTVSRSLVDHNDLEREEAIEWVLVRNLTENTSRVERLHIVANALGIHRTNTDFINPVDSVSIPGIPTQPVNSIDELLNNPNRQAPARFQRLLDRAEDAYNGRFREVIENEIRELIPGYSAPELPNSVGNE